MVFFFFFYGLLILSLILFGFFYYDTYKKHFRDHVQENLTTVADTKISSFLEWRQNRIQDTLAIQQKLELSKLEIAGKFDLLSLEYQNKVFAQLAELQSISQYELLIFKPNGHLAFSFPKNKAPFSVATVSLIHKVAESGKIEWFDLHRMEQTDKIYMGYMIPLLDKKNQSSVYAVAYLRIDPSVYLYPLLQKWPTDSKTAETLVVRREGDHVLFLNDVRFSSDTALNKTIPLHKREVPAVQAALGRIGYFEGVDYRGSAVVSELRPIPNSDWWLVTKMDKSEVFAFLYERITKLILILLLMAFLFFILLVVVRKIQIRDFLKNQAEEERIEQEFKEDIRLANEKANLYLSLVGSIIVVIDQDEKVSMINDAGCKLLGFTREEILGQNWFERFLPQEEIERVRITFSQILNGVVLNVEFYENRVVTKSGELVDIAWHNNLLRDKEGTVIGTVSSGEDVTEKKLAHQAIIQLNEELEEKVKQRTRELEDANNELETFAYTVAHDLRAPLRAMDGFAHMVIDEYATTLDSEAIRLLTVIRTNAHQMDQLIYDLLTMSKVSRSDMVISEINMTIMVKAIFDDLMNQKNISTIEFIVDPLPSCYGDYALLYQVWANLIGNAIKYSSKREKSLIEIKGEKTINSVVYSIKDNGCGFNPLYQNKLFAPFQRLHSSQEFEGTGIGLSIVERVMKRHMGSVWAIGEEGVGATFYISLPREVR